MLGNSKVAGMIPVKDFARAQKFYGETLGMDVQVVVPDNVAFMKSGGGLVSMYQTDDNAGKSPATIAGFQVEDIEAVVEKLNAEGIAMERYPNFNMDDKGIARGEGPPAAWFKDPDGNILAVFEGA